MHTSRHDSRPLVAIRTFHHPRVDLEGPIQNPAEVPGDAKAGDRLSLAVAFATERQIAFRYVPG